MVAKRRYGRGTYEAHPNDVACMRTIVESPWFVGMPNAVSADGHINWQVSSGQATGFYQYHLARKEWWEAKCIELGITADGRETKDGFTIAARLINPTGDRPCRICGEEYNVGYLSLNASLSRRLNRQVEASQFSKNQSIADVLEDPDEDGLEVLAALFPERREAFDKYGIRTGPAEAHAPPPGPLLSKVDQASAVGPSSAGGVVSAGAAVAVGASSAAGAASTMGAASTV